MEDVNALLFSEQCHANLILTVVFRKVLLFVIYAPNLFEIVEKHLPTTHRFADDTQLYLSFKPDDTTCQNDAINAIDKCVDDLRNWMITDLHLHLHLHVPALGKVPF